MWCLGLAAALSRVEAHGRSGGMDWRLGEGVLGGALGGALDGVLDAAWRKGIALNASLVALREALLDAHELNRERRALRVAFYVRTALGLAAAAGTRYALIGGKACRVITPQDGMALLLALAVLAAAQAVLACALPLPWLGKATLNEVAYLWLESHLEASAVPGAPKAEELRRLGERELGIGVSLRLEKREVLAQWSRDQMQLGRQRLKRVEDLLPVLELVGVGLPLVLVVVEPLGEVLQRV